MVASRGKGESAPMTRQSAPKEPDSAPSSGYPPPAEVDGSASMLLRRASQLLRSERFEDGR